MADHCRVWVVDLLPPLYLEFDDDLSTAELMGVRQDFSRFWGTMLPTPKL